MFGAWKNIYSPNVTKKSSNREKQVIVLMISNEEGQRWYYLAVKRLSALLRGNTLKNNGDFYCLNCLHYFKTWIS